jgi:hypothetical protein
MAYKNYDTECIEIIEEKIDKLFADAIDVDDTIWYTKTETLRDAIIHMVDGEISARFLYA